eukprot:jgi/Ulvmu1/5753/UM025_0007.1
MLSVPRVHFFLHCCPESDSILNIHMNSTVRRSCTSLYCRCTAVEWMVARTQPAPTHPDPRSTTSPQRRHLTPCMLLHSKQRSSTHSLDICSIDCAVKSQMRWYAKTKNKGKASRSSPSGAGSAHDFQIELYRAKMELAVEHFYHELSGVRTGRASPTLLDSVMVDFHGERTNLSHFATVVLKRARMLAVTIYDKDMAPEVLAAIRESPLQLQPREEGGEILVPVPEMSPEARRAMIKLAHQYAEQSRVTIRQIRHKAMLDIKASAQQSSEDDRKRNERQTEEMTKLCVRQVDAALHAKEKELNL